MAQELSGTIAFCAAMMLAVPASGQDALPTREEMWAIIQQQQAEIERLKERLDITDEKVEAAGEMIAEAGASSDGGQPGWWERTSLGGYGELHYNGGDVDELDLHRFVLFLGHEFNDRFRLATEIEIEHALAGDGAPGEVEIEQAFIEYDINANFVTRAGVFLIPAGILNETHEPPTFFGVERNRVESEIIPTTWWEAGAGLTGRFGTGLSFDVAATGGLNTPITGGSAFRIRSGRQKVAESIAKDPALTGRLRWTGIPGVELGVTGQWQSDITQSQLGISAALVEAHADILIDGWGLRALYARWKLEDGAPGTGPAALGRDVQYGWYVEPSYRFPVASWGQLGVFARYSQLDNFAGNSVSTRVSQFDIGVNYWPIPDIVLKADFQWAKRPAAIAADDDNRLNVGIGWQF